jgi:hypothetical protein
LAVPVVFLNAGAKAGPKPTSVDQHQGNGSFRLPKLEAEVDFLKINKLSAADVLHEADSLQERWPSLPTEEKRKIVEALIEKIVIGNGEIDITFSHLPSSEELCKSQRGLGPG